MTDIFSRSGDIRDQSLKWSKIDRNFARFWPPDFFRGGGNAPPPNFWTCIIKLGQIPTMWQSFRAIGRGNSENAWRKKTSLISPPVTTYGRPNKYNELAQSNVITLKVIQCCSSGNQNSVYTAAVMSKFSDCILKSEEHLF